MNLKSIAAQFSTPEAAREFLEKQRWPEGPVCPHCGVIDASYRLTARPGSKSPVRPGVWKCRGCCNQYTVTRGTVFEGSHIPLNTWLITVHLVCSSKKGVSAHQIHRMLGITYKAAWFMVHRLRYAATQDPLAAQLAIIGEWRAANLRPILYHNIEYGTRVLTGTGAGTGTMFRDAIHPRKHDQLNQSANEYGRYQPEPTSQASAEAEAS